MARLIRYVGKAKGIRKIRGSHEMDEMLERRASRIAGAANTVYSALGEDVHAEVVQQGSDTPAPRARVAVIARGAAAMRTEAHHRVLGGSLDAARG